jgi:hypothetical protein
MRSLWMMSACMCIANAGCANAWGFGDLQHDDSGANDGDAAHGGGSDGGMGGDGSGNGGVEGGGGSDGGTTSDACLPTDMTNFQPHWVPPTQAHQGLCTQSEISNFVSACLSSAGGTSCNQFGVSNTACYACLTVSSTASEYGPLVVYEFPGFGDDDVNVGGCIAAAQGNATGAGCAGSVAAADECQREACDICGSYSAFQTCVTSATAGTCASWVQTATTCAGALTSPGSACVPGTTGVALFETIAAVFCGP